jgi:hypothetical protein
VAPVPPGSVGRAPGRAPTGPGRVRHALIRPARTIGLVLVVLPPLAWAAFGPAAALGVRPDPAVTVAAAGPTDVGGWRGATGVTVTAVAGHVETARWPVTVTIPALGATLPVEPVGLDAAGDVAIPASPARVGWDRRAAVPGRPGTAVLAVHVDSRTEGVGVFAGLVELAVGDPVLVTDAAGRTSTWTVVAREAVAKEDLPVDRLAALHGPPTLALVTCGGAFDPVARRYAQNVIVWALPVDDARAARRS